MKNKSNYLLVFILAVQFKFFASQSLFDSLEKTPQTVTAPTQAASNPATPPPILQPKEVTPTTTPVPEEDPALANLNSIIEKMKDKVENPSLKNNLTVEAISNFFANMLSGNEIMNNLEVKKLAHVNKLEVGEKIKAEGESEFNSIEVKESFKSKVFNITDDRITFNPEATLKMTNSRLIFKVKDIFEVITFMKYIVKVCGNKLERCDFGNLLKNNQTEQMQKIMKLIENSSNFKLSMNDKNASNKGNNLRGGKQSQTQTRNQVEYSFKETKTPAQTPAQTPAPVSPVAAVTPPTPQPKKDPNLMFDHQDEIEKELNLQLKMYKEKQKQDLFDNSYEQFLNKNIMSGGEDDTSLNEYYYNLDSNLI